MGKNVTELTETTTTSGAYLEITIPDGIGGFLSRKISFANLAVAIKEGITIEKLSDQSAAFTKSFDAGTFLLSIVFQYVSGGSDVKIKIGTTSGGYEISLIPAGTPVPENGNLSMPLDYNFDTTDTIYIDISGGVVDITFLYITNFI